MATAAATDQAQPLATDATRENPPFVSARPAAVAPPHHDTVHCVTTFTEN